MANLGSAQLLALAWSMGWRIAAGLIIGYYIDQWLGSSPWMTLLLSLAALVAGVRQMIVLLEKQGATHTSDNQ